MLEPRIISVKELLQIDNLQIPDYQRPYKWTEKNVNQLVDDILFHSDKSAYRLGTVVIHEEKKGDRSILNIVDGQQRSLTLTLIAYAIIQNCKDYLSEIFQGKQKVDENNLKLLTLEFSNDITKSNIRNNYKAIERRIKDFDKKTICFFFNKCELVEVILTDISEAFQFFDSQNSRGKDLEPHDLLKAFHLREMNKSSSEEERKVAVENWESMDTDKLSKLFELYLFRIRNWSKGYSARYFTKNDIDVFKGVNLDLKEDYPFAKLFRIAHYYTEDYNHSVYLKVNQRSFEYPFQIDQTIINGKRFFEMVTYYDKLINKIKNIENNQVLDVIKEYEGRFRTGDKYIRNLFYCALIYYIDKFGEKELAKAIDKIFIWAYSLRLKLKNVGLESIDNYALNYAHSEIQIFKKIREALHHNEFFNIQLSTLNGHRSSKTGEIVEIFKSLKYYYEQKN